MNISLRIVITVALVIYYSIIFYLLKKRALTLKYTLLWIASGCVMILIVIFPRFFDRIIHIIGVVELTNGLFAVVLFAVLIILISITSIVSKMSDNIRQLTQKCAMYEIRLREVERKMSDDGKNGIAAE